MTATESRPRSGPDPLLWIGTAVLLGFLFGQLAMAWITGHDSHTGVGMGGLAMWIASCLVAGVVGLVGLILTLFRATRRIGIAMFAGGVTMLATTWLSL